MALLSFDKEMARAVPGRAFTDRNETEHWISIWCDECQHSATCPLPMVALLARLPAAWQKREDRARKSYLCQEFTPEQPGT